jgi:hypothetical protein
LLAVLGDAIRSTLEMEMKEWKPRSDWGKRLLANAKGEGRAEERAASIVELLEVRGIPLDPPLYQRITSCTDYEVLTQWFRRAATATLAEELFAS